MANVANSPKNMEKKKVVLAFSGGLDTSFCVKYLSEEKGYEVHTAIANTGGFSKQELEKIAERAEALGNAELSGYVASNNLIMYPASNPDFVAYADALNNLFVAGEAVGGIHGENRLMGNSLLDIIVFGRNAGINAAAKAKETTVGELTLNHVNAFAEELKEAGIVTDKVSPVLLPRYTHGNPRFEVK